MEKLIKEYNKLNIYEKLDFLEDKYFSICPEERLIETSIEYWERKYEHNLEEGKKAYNSGNIETYRYYANMNWNINNMIIFLKDWGNK